MFDPKSPNVLIYRAILKQGFQAHLHQLTDIYAIYYKYDIN